MDIPCSSFRSGVLLHADQLQPVADMGPVGEIRLVPDPDSFVILPYAPHSAAMMCDMLTLERVPWGACPRTFLNA